MKGRPGISVEAGSVFGRLTVIGRADGYTGKGAFYRCLCECGAKKDAAGYSLRAGKVRSCGCLQRESRVHHGASYTVEYQAWRGMKRRCYNPSSPGYDSWGGRGIAVCDRWKNSFESFLADMGERPGEGYSLDRIDVDGNYEPGNCRWATAATQSRNKRSQASKTGVKGVHPMPNGRDFKASLSVDDKTIHIGVFPSLEEAEKARKAAESRYWGCAR